MASGDKAFTGSIPAIYDEYLVPVLFAPYAEDLVRRLGGMAGGRLLEIAAGSGALTRALARALPPAVAIVASDLNQPMLDVSAARITDRRIEWRAADAGALPFDDREFDAVVCQFGVMFCPDKIRAFAEARRVLAAGGRYLFNVWDKLDTSEFSHVAIRALAKLFPEDPPSFFERIPHGYHDVAEIRETLTAAGFANTEIETVEKSSRAPSPRAAAIGICQGTPLRNEIEARDASRLEEATDAVAAALAAKFGSGAIEGRMRAFVVTAR
ncbi:MAG: methyltransferase domain-containing protein [Methylobacteriaceae bacterium]|nr:methyltransferase domain-containing protein [Methylobacteriaceae bacterium]